MSAGSKTNPGGYSVTDKSLEQFSISDERSPSEIALMLRSKGYEPVWKDWDSSYQGKGNNISEDGYNSIANKQNANALSSVS